MKKLLVALTVVLMLVSVFAAEKPFTLGPVRYTGTVQFLLGVTKDGVDISGSLLNVSASLVVSPRSDTQAGATFSISYSTLGAAPTLTLSSISFTTPYFGAFYSVDKQFVSDYFTGRNYNASGNPWTSAFGSHFADSLKLTFPAIKGLEIYYVDKTSEGNATWFSDMLLAKYVINGWEVVGGTYNEGDTTTHEFGGALIGSLDLGVIKPTVQAFAGLVNGGSGMVTAYDFNLSGKLQPVAGLTLEPTVKFAENLNKLEYRSSNILDKKFVRLGVTYSQTFAPVTLKASFTPEYNFENATPTLSLGELSAKIDVAPVSLLVRTTNKNVLDDRNKYTLYAEGNYNAAPLSLKVYANWDDLTNLSAYKHIHAEAKVTVDALGINANYRQTPSQSGYNVSADYNLAQNVTLSAFYGTLELSGDAWNFLPDPKWFVRLIYTAKF